MCRVGQVVRAAYQKTGHPIDGHTGLSRVALAATVATCDDTSLWA